MYKYKTCSVFTQITMLVKYFIVKNGRFCCKNWGVFFFFLALLTLEEQYDLIILKRYACVGVGDNWSNSCKPSELTVSCQWQFSGLENIPWLYRRWLLRKLGEGYIESVLFFNFLWVLNCFQKNYLRNKSNAILIAMTTSSGKRVPQRPWPWAPPFKGKIVLALQAQPYPWPSAILSLLDAWRRLLEPASELRGFGRVLRLGWGSMGTHSWDPGNQLTRVLSEPHHHL